MAIITSFRTRIFFITASVVMLTLAGVIYFGWINIVRYETARFEERLCYETRRISQSDNDHQPLLQLSVDITHKLGLNNLDDIYFRRNLRGGSEQFHSANWGGDFETAILSGAKFVAVSNLISAKASEGSTSSLVSTARGPSNFNAAPTCNIAGWVVDGTDWKGAQVEINQIQATLIAKGDGLQQPIRAMALEILKNLILPALTLVLLAAAIITYYTLTPLKRLRIGMLSVNTTTLSQKLPIKGEDREFRELTDSFNVMLGRLDSAVQQANRFSADASHELKTPLTILQTTIERFIRQSNDSEISSQLSGMLSHVIRLGAITRKLLLLSQAAAGSLVLNMKEVAIGNLLNEMADDIEMVIDQRLLSREINSEINIKGDEILLQQLLNNVISNAVRYRSEQGWIRITLFREDENIVLMVANKTNLVSDADRSRFFDRFFRAEGTRNRAVDGSGLGLSFALEIARAHRGNLLLLPSPRDEVHIQVQFPAPPR